MWRTAARWLGLVPLIAGGAWALVTPAPDLLVTGDGRHLALRAEDGTLRLLRPRAGDYVREQLAEGSGIQADALALDAAPGARCSIDLCLATVARGGRHWRLLATRSAYPLDKAELARACAWADIAVSDRRLPTSCAPRRLKLDAPVLARSGGIAVNLAGGAIRTVAGDDHHPWAAAGAVTAAPLRHRRWGLHGPHRGAHPPPGASPSPSIGFE